MTSARGWSWVLGHLRSPNLDYCSGRRGFRVGGRCAGVETSPTPFSSAVSPPREVGGLSRSGPLSGGCCGAKVDSRQSCPPKC